MSETGGFGIEQEYLGTIFIECLREGPKVWKKKDQDESVARSCA